MGQKHLDLHGKTIRALVILGVLVKAGFSDAGHGGASKAFYFGGNLLLYSGELEIRYEILDPNEQEKKE